MSFALIFVVPEEALELASSLCFDEGALGVETQEHGMLLMPGTPALPEGCGRCIAHFDELTDASDAAAVLAHQLPELEVPAPIEIVAENWSTSWRAHHKKARVGKRSWVHPPWDLPTLAEGEVHVAIDPGMAFGTGAHPTTALCLERTDELLAEKPGASLLDVGTGSGVVAILAAKLGAGRVCGTENDPIAIAASKEGAALNNLGPERIGWKLCDCDELPPPYDQPYDIVIANILLNTLIDLAPQIARKVAPGGHLVLSGLLEAQGDEAQAAYLAEGLRPLGREERDGWLRVELTRTKV